MTRPRDEADLVVLELVRLTTADNWDKRRAARAVLAKRHSTPALRLAQRRAQRARAGSASRIADRAAETLAEALELLAGTAADTAGCAGADRAPEAAGAALTT